jgi:hypothetical protein
VGVDPAQIGLGDQFAERASVVVRQSGRYEGIRDEGAQALY